MLGSKKDLGIESIQLGHGRNWGIFSTLKHSYAKETMSSHQIRKY